MSKEYNDMSMTEYYRTKHWRLLSSKVLNQDSTKCQVCGRPRWSTYKINTKKHKKGDRKRLLRFNYHHMHYNTLGQEKRSDMLTLCSSCHDMCHSIQRIKDTGQIWGKIYTILGMMTPWKYEKRIKKTTTFEQDG